MTLSEQVHNSTDSQFLSNMSCALLKQTPSEPSELLLCECCESQPATIQCYTCLMYLCAVSCHYRLRCHTKDYTGIRHRYVVGFQTASAEPPKKLAQQGNPGYVNMMPRDAEVFEEWCALKSGTITMSLMSAEKLKVQSRVLLESLPNLIPELVNIINEYVASKATVQLQLDCLDFTQNWYVGEILEIANEEAFVRFPACNISWSEWIHLKSKRFAPLYTYTNEYTNCPNPSI